MASATATAPIALVPLGEQPAVIAARRRLAGLHGAHHRALAAVAAAERAQEAAVQARALELARGHAPPDLEPHAVAIVRARAEAAAAQEAVRLAEADAAAVETRVRQALTETLQRQQVAAAQRLREALGPAIAANRELVAVRELGEGVGLRGELLDVFALPPLLHEAGSNTPTDLFLAALAQAERQVAARWG